MEFVSLRIQVFIVNDYQQNEILKQVQNDKLLDYLDSLLKIF